MAVIIDGTTGIDTIEPTIVPAALNASGSAPVYAARAWVNFNGTGTVAIRASGNVSSITDNGTGFYTVNIATALADSNYSVVGTSNQGGAIYIVRTGIATKTTTACDLSHNSTTAATDGIISVAIFR